MVNTEREILLEGLVWNYYARHQHGALCQCRLCVYARKLLKLQVEVISAEPFTAWPRTVGEPGRRS